MKAVTEQVSSNLIEIIDFWEEIGLLFFYMKWIMAHVKPVYIIAIKAI